MTVLFGRDRPNNYFFFLKIQDTILTYLENRHALTNVKELIISATVGAAAPACIKILFSTLEMTIKETRIGDLQLVSGHLGT